MKYTCDAISHIFWSRTWTREGRGCKKYLVASEKKLPEVQCAETDQWTKLILQLLRKYHCPPFSNIQSSSFDPVCPQNYPIFCAFTSLSSFAPVEFPYCFSTAPIAPPSSPSCLTWTKIFWPPPNLISTSVGTFCGYSLFVTTKTKRQSNSRKNQNRLIKLFSQTFLLNSKDTKGRGTRIRVN